MVRTKVFVGNLSFKTREQELAAAFQVAGKVVSANIITRGPRSLGYGFVELESEEDAQHAAAIMNKKVIDDREINVEIAKPREETLDKPPPRPRRPRLRGAPKKDGAPATTSAPNNNAPKDAAAAPAADGGDERRVRRRRRRIPAGGAATGGAPAAGGASAAPGQATSQGPQGQPQGEQQQRRRRPRRPKAETTETPQQPRASSKTTLFVANLPFSVDDDGLSKIFTGLSIKSAHVVKKRNGRSKGFGFVEFDSEDAQAKAKNAIDKKVVDDRELIVKVALTENPATQSQEKEEKKDAPKA
jgi:RNA recognition motif-containing protein